MLPVKVNRRSFARQLQGEQRPPSTSESKKKAQQLVEEIKEVTESPEKEVKVIEKIVIKEVEPKVIIKEIIVQDQRGLASVALQKVKESITTLEEVDEEKQSVLKEDMTSQTLSFDQRLANRRKEKGLPEKQTNPLSPSTDTSNNAVPELNSDETEFKEIFNVLDQLEKDNAEIFETAKAQIEPEIEVEETEVQSTSNNDDAVTDFVTEAAPEDYQIEKQQFIDAYVEMKKQQISIIKKKYESRIAELKKQDDPMSKTMLKKLKEERDGEVDELKKKLSEEKRQRLKEIKRKYR